MIFNVYGCSECKEAVYGRDNFNSHLCKEDYDLEPTCEFDSLIPQSGLLHYKMNAGIAFMTLCWDPFMKEVCKELGFVTENAQLYARKGSDHHKLWDILQICYIAFTDELLVEFVRSCKSMGTEPTVLNYCNFCSKVKNANYLFVQPMTLTFQHALMLSRNGMRMNNIERIYAGKNKLSLLFFGRNHPCYHELVAYEKKIEALMSYEIRSIKFCSLVLGRTGRLVHYQSGDAMIEEINKEAKRDLVGVPNEHQWRRSFRNLDNVNDIRQIFFCRQELRIIKA